MVPGVATGMGITIGPVRSDISICEIGWFIGGWTRQLNLNAVTRTCEGPNVGNPAAGDVERHYFSCLVDTMTQLSMYLSHIAFVYRTAGPFWHT